MTSRQALRSPARSGSRYAPKKVPASLTIAMLMSLPFLKAPPRSDDGECESVDQWPPGHLFYARHVKMDNMRQMVYRRLPKNIFTYFNFRRPRSRAESANP